jgi:hypothetical protein
MASQNEALYVPCKAKQEYNQHSRYHMGNSIQALNRKSAVIESHRNQAELGNFSLDKTDTQYNFWSPIMPSGYHITLILSIIGSATEINHLDSIGLGQPLIIGSLLWGLG